MKKDLTLKETILIASTLFGMFFGAGNLIFPVHLGQMAGHNAWLAILGFVITAVSIPILGVAALASTRSDNLLVMSSKVGKPFAYVFTCTLLLTIGPFFAIPRCAATSFSTGVSPLLGEGSNLAAQLIFTAVFFAVVLFFSLRPSGIVTWIGMIINPTFLVFLSILIVVALSNPSAVISAVQPIESYEKGALFNGIIEGYGTMDAIASLAFGVVVVDSIKRFGVTKEDDIARNTVKAGIFTAVLMALIYALTIIMGAQSRGAFELSDNGGIALAQLSNYYLGSFGSIALAITVTFACLKTAIGLVTSCSSLFAEMFPKLVYEKWVLVFTAFSFLVSNVGLTAIITYAVPVLMLIYPITIVVIVLALCNKLFDGSRYVYICVVCGACVSAIFDFIKALPFGIDVSFAAKIFPFFNLGCGWVVPSCIGLLIGLALKQQSDNKSFEEW